MPRDLFVFVHRVKYKHSTPAITTRASPTHAPDPIPGTPARPQLTIHTQNNTHTHIAHSTHLNRFTFFPCATSSNSLCRTKVFIALCAAPISIPCALRSLRIFAFATTI